MAGERIALEGGTSGETVVSTELDAFCRAHHPRLVGMLSLYTGDRADAEDLAQETLVRVIRDWDRLSGGVGADRWATRVAFNLAKSSRRTRRRRQEILEQHSSNLAGPAAGALGADGTVDAVVVRRCVAALPERPRRALLLRYYADLPVAEVARVMECPEGTVKTLTFDAIRRLRRMGLEVSDE